jgi:hypothetical protein
MGGGGGVVWMRRWWGCGRVFANTRCERGLGAKNHETERGGLILGTPCKTAVMGDGGRSWHGVDEVVVVVGLLVCQREVGEGAGDQKPQNQVLWLDFGSAM